MAEIKPLITTVANGRCTSAPAPVANAIGTKPSDATNAVIETGRRRRSAPSGTASAHGSCFARSSIKPAITSPLRTATPDNAMNPTAAEIENGRPRDQSAAIRLIPARGTPVNTTAAAR